MKIISLLFAVVMLMTSLAHADEASVTLLQRAAAYRQRGDDTQAAQLLRQALPQASSAQERQRIAALLGETLLDLRQYDEAARLLNESAQAGSARERAQIIIDLGNLKVRQKHGEEARAHYLQAVELAADAPELRWAAELNLAALEAPADRPAKLRALADKLPSVTGNSALAARLAVSLGAQAAALGTAGQDIALPAYNLARQRAEDARDARRLAEAYDGLGQLYETRQHGAEAMKLTELGIGFAQQDKALDLLVGLEARRGRLLRAGGKLDQARAAYSRSVDYLQQLRHAIPIEYQNGRSSFRDTLEPIYLELADLLLQKGAESVGDEQQQLFRQARDTLETMKRAELDDYLGDRCATSSTQGTILPPGTAVLYPVLLKDRVDVLLETSAGLRRGSMPIPGNKLRKDASRLARLMRAGESLGDLPSLLYDIMIRPLEGALTAQKIDTLIVVPDGPLRMIPFGALHDGESYLIEKFAVAVAPGLSMLGGGAAAGRSGFQMLLAGMSEAGNVVNKLTPEILSAISGDAEASTSRSLVQKRGIRDLASNLAESRSLIGDTGARERQLKTALALPGVKDEVAGIGKVAKGQTLLDGDFTMERFRQQVTSGRYRMVHIASHGVFGGSAEGSFVLAYDDLIGLNALQAYLASEALEAAPIELLTLSACQTAEGNDRAPLGIAGAALKARARAALGSLWPVSDEASMNLMNTFYSELSRTDITKAKALQQAQLAVMGNPNFSHPFFWAPFILVGNWQ